ALGAGLSQPAAPMAHPTPTPAPASAPTPAPALSASGPIPDNWEPTGFNNVPAAHAAPSAPTPAPAEAAAAPPPPPTTAAAAAASGGGADLLTSLGLEPASVDPAIQQQLGAVLRIAVQGLMDVLKSRAEVKSTFRLPI